METRGLRLYFFVIEITISSIFGLKSYCQFPDQIINQVNDANIRSVWLGSAEWDFSMPVIELGGDQKLELRFDDLSDDSRSFGYTMIHCDKDWKKSDLVESEYLSGFGRGIIRDSKHSFNTTVSYINYRLVFPEDDCSPAISGNYVLVVYDESDPEDIILTRRFYVSESLANIEAAVRQPTHGQERESSQQLHFSVTYDEREIRDPAREITVVALQNYRYDTKKVFRKAWTSRPGLLEYNDPEGGIFYAGNEFRSLDIKSMRYQTENVASIEFRNPYYHVVMKADDLRSNKPWFSKADLNGSYYIDRERSNDRHTEADYVYVTFRLELPVVYSAQEVFVTGGFNEWTLNETSRMKFNPENGLFENTLLMKQGLYDYCFYTVNPETGKSDELDIEGSFYETGNDYSIFVYFHDQFKRYDRLIGYLPIK